MLYQFQLPLTLGGTALAVLPSRTAPLRVADNSLRVRLFQTLLGIFVIGIIQRIFIYIFKSVIIFHIYFQQASQISIYSGNNAEFSKFYARTLHPSCSVHQRTEFALCRQCVPTVNALNQRVGSAFTVETQWEKCALLNSAQSGKEETRESLENSKPTVTQFILL
jgi:hypothetical protein